MNSDRGTRSFGMAASLVGLALLLVLYWRSFSRVDVVAAFGSMGTVQAVLSSNGRIFIFLSNVPVPGHEWRLAVGSSESGIGADVLTALGTDLKAKHRVGQFEWWRKDRRAFGLRGRWYSVLAVPYWLLAVLTLVLPARGVWMRFRRWRRGRRGLCVECGYDLRGSPEGCPECGCRAPSGDEITHDLSAAREE